MMNRRMIALLVSVDTNAFLLSKRYRFSGIGLIPGSRFDLWVGGGDLLCDFAEAREVGADLIRAVLQVCE